MELIPRSRLVSMRWNSTQGRKEAKTPSGQGKTKTMRFKKRRVKQ